MDQLLQSRNFGTAEASLLLPFPKLIRIDEDRRVTFLLLKPLRKLSQRLFYVTFSRET